MQQLKIYLKLFIGIAVLVFFIVGFFFYKKSSDLESGNMTNWSEAPLDRRTAAVKILTGGEEYTESMMVCLDKVASLPDTSEMSVRDAAALCYIGIQLKDSV